MRKEKRDTIALVGYLGGREKRKKGGVRDKREIDIRYIVFALAHTLMASLLLFSLRLKGA